MSYNSVRLSIAPADYIAISIDLNFVPNGEVRRCINVTVVEDSIFEPTQSFGIALNSTDSEIVIRPNFATTRIMDNDCEL